MSVHELQTDIRVRNLKRELRRKDAEIRKLKNALRAFIAQDEIIDEDEEASVSSLSGEEEKEDIEEGPDSLPQSINIDAYPGSSFCVECRGEVVEGACYFCFKEHEWPEDDFFQEPASTDTQAIHPDRSLVPRGDTPVREIGDQTLRSLPTEYQASLGHPSRADEYWELLRRGATQLMCETFLLEFNYATGIYAWADFDLFEEFSGPAMKTGDRWKIHLGRRINLEEDDLDGSAFIEGLLEDALLFPFRSAISNKTHEKWETRLETPGIWVTRLQHTLQHTRIDQDGSDSDSSDCHWKEYEMEDEALENPPLEMPVIRPNTYDLSDDDSEQCDLGVDDPGFFTTDRPDAVWNAGSEINQLTNHDEPMDGGSQSDSQDATADDRMEDSNSDDAGSDFDSDEVLSGDEIVLSRVSKN